MALLRTPRVRGLLLLGLPVLFLLLAFVYPVASIIGLSFTDPEPGFGQYADIFGSESTRRILLRTVGVALMVSLVGLLLAYPYAVALRLCGPRTRLILIALVLMPFWISLIARTFAWVVLLRRGGPLSALTGALGLGDGPLLGTTTAVVISMVQVLLPFMILPIYNSMTDIDLGLMKAAASLGARRFTQFRTVFVPLSAPGVVAGGMLVFVMCLGFYLTPELVGSPQKPVVGQLIALRVNTLLDFANAGALATILLVVILAVLVLMNRLGGKPAGIEAGAVALRGGKH